MVIDRSQRRIIFKRAEQAAVLVHQPPWNDATWATLLSTATVGVDLGGLFDWAAAFYTLADPNGDGVLQRCADGRWIVGTTKELATYAAQYGLCLSARFVVQHRAGEKYENVGWATGRPPLQVVCTVARAPFSLSDDARTSLQVVCTAARPPFSLSDDARTWNAFRPLAGDSTGPEPAPSLSDSSVVRFLRDACGPALGAVLGALNRVVCGKRLPSVLVCGAAQFDALWDFGQQLAGPEHCVGSFGGPNDVNADTLFLRMQDAEVRAYWQYLFPLPDETPLRPVSWMPTLKAPAAGALCALVLADGVRRRLQLPAEHAEVIALEPTAVDRKQFSPHELASFLAILRRVPDYARQLEEVCNAGRRDVTAAVLRRDFIPWLATEVELHMGTRILQPEFKAQLRTWCEREGYRFAHAVCSGRGQDHEMQDRHGLGVGPRPRMEAAAVAVVRRRHGPADPAGASIRVTVKGGCSTYLWIS